MNYVGKVDEEEEIGGNILIHAETKRLIVPITIGEVDYIPGSVIWKK